MVKKLVLNAVLRKDDAVLGVLRDRLGENALRDMTDVEYDSAKGIVRATSRQINAALDKLTPTVRSAAPGDERVMRIEAFLLEQGKKVTVDGALSDAERLALADAMAVLPERLGDVHIGEVETQLKLRPSNPTAATAPQR